MGERALQFNCHMHPERTVSFGPDAHKVLLLAHAQRVWDGVGVGGSGGVINGNVCNTTFVAYDLLNASA